jgi:hypothetical protein
VIKSDIKILSMEDLRQVVDRKEKILEIPEWGGAIVLKALSLAQRDAMMMHVTDNGRADGKPDPIKMIRALVLHGVHEPRLSEEFLLEQAYEVVDRIAQAVLEINGMIKTAQLTSDLTFREQPVPAVPVQVGEGFGQNGRGTS